MTSDHETNSSGGDPLAPRPTSDGQGDDPDATLDWLVGIMERLLAPDGCPWDREQTLETLRPYLLEECYEVLDAIDSGDGEQHCEELGDLLLQIVFQAQIATIPMARVIRSIGEKLIRRHPHVFADTSVRDSSEVVTNWEAIKATEKKTDEHRTSVFHGVPRALPALHLSHKLARRASKTSVALPDPRGEVDTRLAETDRASATPGRTGVAEAFGDLLFALASWATSLGVEPEQALRDAARRFTERVDSHQAAPTDDR